MIVFVCSILLVILLHQGIYHRIVAHTFCPIGLDPFYIVSCKLLYKLGQDLLDIQNYSVHRFKISLDETQKLDFFLKLKTRFI